MAKVLRKTGLVATAVAVAAAAPLLAGQAKAQAQSAHSNSVTATIQTLATGLNAPRGLVWDRFTGQVLVAEAGSAAGNNGPCGKGEDGTPLCYGPTGSVFDYSILTRQGHRIITGLPSESDPGKSFVLGLHDISLTSEVPAGIFNPFGHLEGVFGLLGTPETRTELGPGAANLDQAVRFTSDGKAVPIADIATFETATYGSDEESDTYGITNTSYGTVITNAGGHAVFGNVGGNDILLLKHGKLSTIAAFPQRVPAANPKDIVESVPTDTVEGPDRALYTGELSGFPYYVGEAKVWRVVPGHAPTLFASGFTNIIDLAFDSRGRLLVLEIAKNGLLASDQTGAIIRINHDGSQTLLASTGLTNPGGLAVVNDNTFLVTNNTAGVGGDGSLVLVKVHGA